MAKTLTNEEKVSHLREMIEDIDFCMLTTMDGESLRSRPMSTLAFEDGALWFFTERGSRKTEDIEVEERVNVSYAVPSKNRFVSVSGQAEVVDDRAKIEKLWSPIHRAWFAGGKDDPKLVLLKVTVDAAEYWDAPNSKMVQLVGLVKSVVTGVPKEFGDDENAKIDLQ